MQNSWLNKNKIELIILSILGLVFNIAIYFQMHGYSISFLDTDDYMRLVRIQDFFNHFDLLDNVIKRCNVPFGCSLHWTRFYDLFLIIPSYLFSFFTESTKNAIEYVGFFIAPVLKTFLLIFLFRISIRLFSRRDAFLAVALIAANPIISQFGTFGRPDHHMFIMMFMTIVLSNVTSLVESKFKEGYQRLAISSALCIWISPETLIPLLLLDAILFAYAIFDLSEIDGSLILKNLYLKNLFVSCFIGIIILPSMEYGFIIVALVTSSLIFIIRKEYVSKISFILLAVFAYCIQSALPVSYDEISLVHFVLYICISLFFYVSFIHKTDSKKVCLPKIFLAFAIFAGVFIYTYPKFFLGMSADISPLITDIWLKKIAEMRSPFEHGDYCFFIVHVIVIAVSVAHKSIELLKNKKNKLEIIWLFLIANSVCYTIFAAFAYRMLPFSILFGFPLIVDFGMNSVHFKKLHRLIRIVLTFFITTLFIFLTAYLKNDSYDSDESHQKKYTTQELFREVDNLSATPVVIMAHSNDGPAILYYTKHKVVGAPYHRQTEGILTSYEVMENDYIEDKTLEELEFVNASYIFIKKSMYENKNDKTKVYKKQSLAKMIVEGKQPKWITIVKLPAKFDDVIIAKIDTPDIIDSD